MNDTTTNPPATASWATNKKTWLILGALAVGLMLVIAPFPWNRWREVHPKEAREGIEFRVAELVAEGVRKYGELNREGVTPRQLPYRLRDLEVAGFLPSPDLVAHGTLNSYTEHFLYFPDGVPTPSRNEGELIVINATSLTVKGVSGNGRYGIWLDRENQVVGPSWIPEKEAQEYLKDYIGRERP